MLLLARRPWDANSNLDTETYRTQECRPGEALRDLVFIAHLTEAKAQAEG